MSIANRSGGPKVEILGLNAEVASSIFRFISETASSFGLRIRENQAQRMFETGATTWTLMFSIG